ncbi:MAG: tryptophan synthase subunit alpha [Campylobacterales bacterium]|nr:tryptophan synthase subunit alpha [Campylobacterales bacterium]
MKKLVGFITSSLPNNNFTVDLALSMKEAGVDTLELGIPFSDPVADGPIIEKASLMALQNGFKLKDLFETTAQIAPHMDTLWMGYLNPYFHFGIEKFLQKAQELGVQGSIIPDLPFEEASSLKPLFTKYNQHLIDFVAPTDGKERIEKITQNSSKFIYLVAYAGITGSGANEDLSKVISNIKNSCDTPIYIGFGVDENTAKTKAKDVDGVIVGSAFVKHLIDQSLTHNEKLQKITQIAKKIKEDINS